MVVKHFSNEQRIGEAVKTEVVCACIEEGVDRWCKEDVGRGYNSCGGKRLTT